jgi:hypothetical protein
MQVIAESKDAFVLEYENQFFLISKDALDNELCHDHHPQLRTIGTFVSSLNGRHRPVYYSSTYAAKIKRAIEERSVAVNTGSVYPPDYFFDEQNRLFD